MEIEIRGLLKASPSKELTEQRRSFPFPPRAEPDRSRRGHKKGPRSVPRPPSNFRKASEQGINSRITENGADAREILHGWRISW